MKSLNPKLLAIGIIATAPLASGVPTTAGAFDLSGKTVTWIVPFKEGGGSDTTARLMQPYLQKALPGNPTIIILNQPGGGSVKASNKFHRTGKTDGTELFIASTSTFVPVTLGAKKVKYDPTEWRALVGLPRGAVTYVNPAKVKVSGNDIMANVKALRGADLLIGGKSPSSAELLELVSLELLGVKNVRPVFGLSTSKKRKAFLRGELNVNQDGTGPYMKKIAKIAADGKAAPVFAYGYRTSDGSLKRDPDLPDIPRLDEVIAKADGKAPAGPGFDAYVSLMVNKVSLSKVIALAKGTPDNIVNTYIEAFKKITANPELAKALKKSVGSLPLTFGKDTADLVAAGTKMSLSARGWIEEFLKTRHNASL